MKPQVIGDAFPMSPMAQTKAVMAEDGTWLRIETYLERQGAGIIEHPADGSANLLEATMRAHASRAFNALLATGSAAEPVENGPAEVPFRETRDAH